MQQKDYVKLLTLLSGNIDHMAGVEPTFNHFLDFINTCVILSIREYRQFFPLNHQIDILITKEKRKGINKSSKEVLSGWPDSILFPVESALSGQSTFLLVPSVGNVVFLYRVIKGTPFSIQIIDTLSWMTHSFTHTLHFLFLWTYQRRGASYQQKRPHNLRASPKFTPNVACHEELLTRSGTTCDILPFFTGIRWRWPLLFSR